MVGTSAMKELIKPSLTSHHKKTENKNLPEVCNKRFRLLAHFMPVVFFCIPCKHKKTSGFLKENGGMKLVHTTLTTAHAITS